MFEPSSRYYRIETVTYTLPDGRLVSYKRRRFVPKGDEMPLLTEVTVTQGERLDLIAARTLGDPEAFWRICDANDAIDPLELLEPLGRRLRIPLPQP
jgi:hypothetical protein